ncbi:phosphatase PAP2 family protein [Novosphingobium sp. KCTC 2891]|uniref:phosphatase PAP2 family protein n=1 Tax=Novosphingobium sp. KCTC 2891 TaxID=2989730 RepID=UPI0022235AD7|nr:phosphatase PAP2 family protein [Novosphingobium sp. KCTC 2891]MCW1384177.1 phosphatase PAP2 family protein [Novosphingobium sp. KCTC 2891]
MTEPDHDRHLSVRVPLPTHGWRISPTHALVAAALCWAGFGVIVWAVEAGRTAAVDSAGLLLWRRGAELTPAGPPWVLEGVRDMTALGGVLLRNLFAMGAIVALLFLRLRREAVLLAATIGGGWIVNSLVKLTVGRPRPMIVPHLTEAGGQSFPSGHSFNAAVVYIAMALAFAAMSPRRSVRWTLVASALLLTLMIAFSRVWLGVHFPSDVVAGWLGGAGWAFLASALLHRPAKAVAEQADAALEGMTPGDVQQKGPADPGEAS